MSKELEERVAPWAMVLHDMLHLVQKDSGCSDIPLGELLKACCKRRSVPLPPKDVKNAILLLAFKHASSGAPVPKGFS